MTDATVADIYIVSRLSRKPIGRPVIYTMVDAYSRLITGVYVGLEGGQYALRLLLQNTLRIKSTIAISTESTLTRRTGRATIYPPKL